MVARLQMYTTGIKSHALRKKPCILGKFYTFVSTREKSSVSDSRIIRQPQISKFFPARLRCDCPLPRFYFHIIASDSFIDAEGSNFENDQEAMHHARQLAAELVKNASFIKGAVVVENEANGGMFEVPLSVWSN